MTPIEQAAEKKIPGWEYYIESLFKQPEGVWFYPSNKGGNQDEYTICADLHIVHNLICRKVTPIWVDGVYKGQRVAFLYRKDLNYNDNDN